MTGAVPAGAPLRVVVAGAGVAGLETIIALRALAADRVAITLVAPGTHFVYEPYSTAAPFTEEDVPRHSLARFARDFDVELATDSLDWVLPHGQRAFLRSGHEVGYDALVVAVGARRYRAWPNVISFRGFKDAAAVRGLVEEIHAGEVRHVAFVVPPEVDWTLPIYELALRVAADVSLSGADTALTLVTPETSPLAVFGEAASDEVMELLRDAGVALETGTGATVTPAGQVELSGRGWAVDCDRVVALPLIEGPGIHGIPCDGRGFVSVDPYGFVRGIAHVYAAGDCVQSRYKQGGLAAQQADVVAEAVARHAGLPVAQRPIEPVLRGLLLTGDKRRFFRREANDPEAPAEVQQWPLWWPGVKLAGNHLAPYLGAAGVTPEKDSTAVEVTLAERAPAGAVPR